MVRGEDTRAPPRAGARGRSCRRGSRGGRGRGTRAGSAAPPPARSRSGRSGHLPRRGGRGRRGLGARGRGAGGRRGLGRREVRLPRGSAPHARPDPRRAGAGRLGPRERVGHATGGAPTHRAAPRPGRVRPSRGRGPARAGARAGRRSGVRGRPRGWCSQSSPVTGALSSSSSASPARVFAPRSRGAYSKIESPRAWASSIRT